MSPRSVYHRFLVAKRELTSADLSWIASSDAGQFGIAATLQHGGDERILGLGRYAVLPGVVPATADVAFEVGDADQGRGIGTLLLEHLARIARERGIAVFHADVAADNRQMLEVFEQSGFQVREALEDSLFTIGFPIAETERFVQVAAERERRAAARSLAAIFAPTSVAVVGASRSEGGIGRAILDNLIRDGYRGAIFPINPNATAIAERPCFASLGAVPSRVDLAIAADPEAAAAAADQLGFPVVLKAIAPGLVHKSDVGGVMLGLGSCEDVAVAARAIQERIAVTGFIVQRQLPRGVEALVGMTSDPTLGPLVVAGIGGTAVELYKDVAFRVTPLDDIDAADMLEQLEGGALLDGYRGGPVADRPALVDVIRRIAALVEVIPELTELDLNPVIVLEPGAGAVIADARMRLSP